MAEDQHYLLLPRVEVVFRYLFHADTGRVGDVHCGAATKPGSNGLNGDWTEREVEESIEHGGSGAVECGSGGAIERGSEDTIERNCGDSIERGGVSATERDGGRAIEHTGAGAIRGDGKGRIERGGGVAIHRYVSAENKRGSGAKQHV